MAITINGSTGIDMASDDSLAFGDVGISADTLFSGRKNVIINGDFDVWQRGTSVGDGSTALNEEFISDRWLCNDGTGGNFILSQQAFTLGQTDVPNEPKYFHRVDFPTTAPSANDSYISQKVESVRTLAGQTCTLSFWYKGTMGGSLTVQLIQSFGTGGSPSSSVITNGDSITLTSGWQLYTYTFTLPSVSGKTLGTDGNDSLWFRVVFPASQTGQFDIAQVQLEKGSQATSFEKRSYGEELALCQRYYQTYTNPSLGSPAVYRSGYVNSTDTGSQETLLLPVRMRSNPTVGNIATTSLLNVSSVSYVGSTQASVSFGPTLTSAGSHFRYAVYFDLDAEL